MLFLGATCIESVNLSKNATLNHMATFTFNIVGLMKMSELHNVNELRILVDLGKTQ